jgi:nucleoredoxin
MQALFGDVLLTKDGEKPTAAVLGGKVVGIYFSAHWCPPCRGFTPQLAESYTNHLKAKGMEIVFVSSDRDEAAFTEYYGEQPWAALPFGDRDRKNALSKRFKVQGIPTLVVVDAEGNTITTDGREAVGSDPKGENFPWVPKTLEELLDFEVQTKDGKVPMASLDGKVLGLYFSGHWCPPCRGYTPQLATKYEEIKAAGLPFEVIFVSSDQNENAFNEYFAEHPWAAMPYELRQRKEDLSSHFGVEGIPTLVLLDTDRSVITKSGRGAVMGDLKDFPFHPKPVTDLAGDADGINEAPAVVVLCEAAGAAVQAEVLAALEPVAAEYIAAAKAKKEDPEVGFFVATSGGGVVPRIRELTGLPPLGKENAGRGNAAEDDAKGAPPTLLLLDVPDNGGYYKPAADAYPMTTAGIKALLSDYEGRKLQRCQLGGDDDDDDSD